VRADLRSKSRKALFWMKHRRWWTLFKEGIANERITEDGLDTRETEDGDVRVIESSL
jgi:hypothetical protein